MLSLWYINNGPSLLGNILVGFTEKWSRFCQMFSDQMFKEGKKTLDPAFGNGVPKGPNLMD